jgi:HAMP domain-containing protein
MSSPRSTRRFVRRFSIVVLLAVFVVGLAGLGAMWLSTPRSQAVTDQNLAELILVGLVLIVLTVVALVGALASRVLVAPMVELTSVVERLRRGELDARAPTDRGSAEVRSVAVQVNALADEVETWRAGQAESERLRRTFSEISRTVREELDLEAVFDVPALIGPALDADRCWLRLARGGRVEDVVRQWHREGLEPLDDIPRRCACGVVRRRCRGPT